MPNKLIFKAIGVTAGVVMEVSLYHLTPAVMNFQYMITVKEDGQRCQQHIYTCYGCAINDYEVMVECLADEPAEPQNDTIETEINEDEDTTYRSRDINWN